MNISLLALLLLLGSAPPEDSRRTETMDRIERLVRLPDGAHPLDAYARFYADAGEGDVEAVYLIPIDFPGGPGETCSEVTLDLELVEAPCDFTAPDWADVTAGERRWVDGVEQLPMISDGGCSVVEIRFDGVTGQVEQVACHGEA